MRAKGRFEALVETPQGREKLKLLIQSFVVAHGLFDLTIDIPEPRFMALSKELDPRIAAAILPATTKKEVAAATRQAVIDVLDELLEIEIPGKAGAN